MSFGGFGGFGQSGNNQQSSGFGGFGSNTNTNNTSGRLSAFFFSFVIAFPFPTLASVTYSHHSPPAQLSARVTRVPLARIRPLVAAVSSGAIAAAADLAPEVSNVEPLRLVQTEPLP